MSLLQDQWMARFVKQTKIRTTSAFLVGMLLLAASGACIAQTGNDEAASGSAPPAVSQVLPAPNCTSVVLSCNMPTRPIAPDHPLLDPATARDQAERAQSQQEQAAAEEALQRRIEFERQHPDAIFVYGQKTTPKESVSDVFNRALGVPSSTLTTSTFDAEGRRTECVSACHGPLCCITSPSALDTWR
jgi:hypothetical protein